MSKYTTGEIAKLCGVSVRTVQYYDARAILVPSEISEGGRRLYSEADLRRMHIICFLREAGVPISRIGELFSEKHPEKVIFVLLDQQEKELQEEISNSQRKLRMVEDIKREMREIENFSVESIGDIARLMKQKKKRSKMLWMMVLLGIPVSALQWVSVMLWITKGLWWLFPVWVAVALVFGWLSSSYYYNHTEYICPECHRVFRPAFREVVFAYHTSRMRRLRCPECGHKGLCVEVYAEKESNNG